MLPLLTVTILSRIVISVGDSVSVNLNDETVPLEKFWTHTGFSPLGSSAEATESLLLSKDELVNLAVISALPNRAISHVRIHWLLNLLTIENDHYDWSKLDLILDRCVSHGLHLIFELMGTPNGQSDNSLVDWNSLCTQLADHLSNKYGTERIQKWIFELWNEPDLKQYNTMNFTLETYKNYAKSCINGIRSRLPMARIGGPAGLFRDTLKHKLCWGFLDDCNALRNRCRIDFVSFHKKASPYNLASEMVETIKSLESKYKNLSSLQFFNSESDLMTGWWKSENWRADVSYAAAVAKLVDLLLPLNTPNIKLLISNDNGFLNVYPEFFDQRTLLTRFNSSSPNANQFIKKPIYIATGMLGFLERRVIRKYLARNSSLSVIPTIDKLKNPSSAVVIFANYEHSAVPSSGENFDIEVVLPVSWRKARYALYVMSNSLPHPKKIWESNGKMAFPSVEVRELMRKSEGPHKILNQETSQSIKLTWEFPSPSVGMLQICSSTINQPRKPLLLHALNISFNEVLLTWKDDYSRCVGTYEVEYCPSNTTKLFRRINLQDLIFCSYQHVNYSGSIEENVQGFYRVRGVNLWGVAGPYSSIVHYYSY